MTVRCNQSTYIIQLFSSVSGNLVPAHLLRAHNLHSNMAFFLFFSSRNAIQSLIATLICYFSFVKAAFVLVRYYLTVSVRNFLIRAKSRTLPQYHFLTSFSYYILRKKAAPTIKFPYLNV